MSLASGTGRLAMKEPDLAINIGAEQANWLVAGKGSGSGGCEAGRLSGCAEVSGLNLVVGVLGQSLVANGAVALDRLTGPMERVCLLDGGVRILPTSRLTTGGGACWLIWMHRSASGKSSESHFRVSLSPQRVNSLQARSLVGCTDGNGPHDNPMGRQ